MHIPSLLQSLDHPLFFHWLCHVCIAAVLFTFLSLGPLHNILNLPQNVIYANFIVTAETFVSTACSCTHIHFATMAPKKKTVKDVKKIIAILEKESQEKIANKELDVHFVKYEEARIRLGAFEERVARKFNSGSEYNLQSLFNLNTKFTRISNSYSILIILLYQCCFVHTSFCFDLLSN